MLIFMALKWGLINETPKQAVLKTMCLSEPYILDGLEFGFDKSSKEL
jgi:hypothetical protein